MATQEMLQNLATHWLEDINYKAEDEGNEPVINLSSEIQNAIDEGAVYVLTAPKRKLLGKDMVDLLIESGYCRVPKRGIKHD